MTIILGLSYQAFAEENNRPPNILIITVDNVGYGDFSIYNEESPIITPNIERLAQEGARLTNFYTAGATCTVSRASLLTGRIPGRHKLVEQLAGKRKDIVKKLSAAFEQKKGEIKNYLEIEDSFK